MFLATAIVYDVRSLPGGMLEHGGFQQHPLVIACGRLVEETRPVPPAVFVMSVARAVQGVAERKRADEALAESEARFTKVSMPVRWRSPCRRSRRAGSST